MFRNKQEQKWAKFFELVGIKYIHNPPHVNIDSDFYYSPSFYLPDVDTSFMEKFQRCKGVYFDVFNEDDYTHWSLIEKFPEPIVKGNLLPVSNDEDAYNLRREQLIDGSYSFMRMFDSIVIADINYHTLKQEHWIESKQYFEKDRMMIPFYEAREADNAVS